MLTCAVCLVSSHRYAAIPRASGKGSDAQANYIVSIAERNCIPVVENVESWPLIIFEVERGDKNSRYLNPLRLLRGDEDRLCILPQNTINALVCFFRPLRRLRG